MSNLAVLARLDPRSVADLDEDEFRALLKAVSERERARSWSSLNEQLAAAVEALWAILAQLQAGIPVGQVKKLRRPKDHGQYPRPGWVTQSKPEKEIVVRSVAEAVRLMRGS